MWVCGLSIGFATVVLTHVCNYIVQQGNNGQLEQGLCVLASVM